MSDHAKVAIFWDYENCSPPASSCGLGYDIVNNIGRMARVFGSVTTFKAYLDISAQSAKSVTLRSELQSSGVSMIDCPHNGRKDVVDKMILVDMLAFAVDHPIPATVILITGDRDYAYAVSTLRLRNYQVILIVPSSPHTPSCLESQASLVIDWSAAVLKPRTEAAVSSQAIRQARPELDASLIAKLSRELEDRSLDDSNPVQHPPSTPYIGTSRIRRTSARDLLEPSKFSKESFDSFQSFKHLPDSPRSSGGDPVLGGLPIPRTPSRSRHASMDAPIPTRARSATVVTQTAAKQAVEPVPSVVSSRNLPGSTARRLSVPDIAGVPEAARSSPPTLGSLDALELSLLYDGPPSSIIICSPLEQAQPVNDAPRPSLKPASSPSSPLNPLSPPFVMTKVSDGSKSCSGSCSDLHQDGATTSVAPLKALDQTASICDTSRIVKGTGASQGANVVADPITDDDEATTRSLLCRASSKDESLDVPGAPKPQHRSIKEEELRPDVPSSGDERAAPAAAAITLSGDPSVGSGNDVNSINSTPISRAPNKPNDSAPAATPAHPTVITPSLPPSAEQGQANESDRPETRTKFQPLVQLLLTYRKNGSFRPSRSIIATSLVQSDGEVYRRAGVLRFKDYTGLAEKAGVIELGGIAGDAWIGLHPSWFRSEVTAKNSQTLPKEVSSPATKLSEVLAETSMSSKSSPIERTVASQSSASSSPNLGSVKTSGSSSNSPIMGKGSFIPAKFRPLIDALVRMRDNGAPNALRSLVGQLLREDVYTGAGVPGFKEYVQLASNAKLVECGGTGGYAWIRLHPDILV